MELKNAIDIFLGEYSKESTRTSYYYVLGDLAGYLGPMRPVSDIKPTHLVEYHQAIRRRNYTDATINKYVKTTKTFFNWLVKLDVLSASPAKQMKMKRLDRFVNREKAMTDEELSQILEYLEWRARYQKRTRDLSLVTFLADSACRAGGAAGLREDWLDLDNLEAVVREKGDKTRTVWYMHRAARSLRMWLIQRSASSGPYVFSNHAEPVTSATVSQIVRRACKAVGIRSLGAHSLRHRKGHQMNAMGISPAIAAIVLGHDNPQTTMDYYYDYTSETAREVVMKLGLPEQPTENNIIRFHSRKGS